MTVAIALLLLIMEFMNAVHLILDFINLKEQYRVAN